jgi:hypothetical protein
MSRVMRNRVSALLLAAMVLMVPAAGLFIPTLGSYLEIRADILAAQARLEQLTRRRLDADAVEAYRQALDALPIEQTGLLSATTDEDAGLRLEAYLHETLQTHGGSVTSVRITGSTTEGDLRVLRAAVSGRVPDREAFALTQKLEFGAPAVFFETFRLQSTNSFGPEEEKRLLELSAVIRVYFAPSEKKDAP